MLNSIKYFTNTTIRLLFVCAIITFPMFVSLYLNNPNMLFGMIISIPFGYLISNKIVD